MEVESVIAFYKDAESFCSGLSDAVKVQSQLYVAVSQVQAQAAAEASYRRLKEILPRTVSLGYATTFRLATHAGVSFVSSVVAISVEQQGVTAPNTMQNCAISCRAGQEESST